jgi:Uma2 family endonuclease
MHMNVPVTRAAEGLARRAFTVADVERMVEVGLIAPDERLEILGGEIVPMSPKGNRHEAIKVALALRWGKRCPEGYAFAQETGLTLDEHTYLDPDFIVFERSVSLGSVRGPDVLLAVEVADRLA